MQSEKRFALLLFLFRRIVRRLTKMYEAENFEESVIEK